MRSWALCPVIYTTIKGGSLVGPKFREPGPLDRERSYGATQCLFVLGSSFFYFLVHESPPLLHRDLTDGGVFYLSVVLKHFGDAAALSTGWYHLFAFFMTSPFPPPPACTIARGTRILHRLCFTGVDFGI